jgi:predicted metal-binding protein
MSQKEKFEAVFREHGFTDFKWIAPEKIVASQWVRMKCVYGCSEYGQAACCPPNVPSVSECEKFFREYKLAAIFHFAKQVDKPEDRFPWTKKINNKLLRLEREIFLSGYRKAFLLFLDSCAICDSCTGAKAECKEPKLARPAPEALAVDVFATVRQLDYLIEVLSDYSQTMNRYAFLLIE